MTEPVVVIASLSHTFARPHGAAPHVALDGVSAAIQPGMITGLVGPDAAGKTTLLRLIAGLLRPAGGHISVFGHDMATEAALAHPAIGYMPQRFGLYEDLSVAENLDLFADLHAMSPALRAERVTRLLRFTGLGPFTARLAGQLSGGMKQKLGLACALLSRPRLLLLDEPSVGVDPASRRDLWAIVAAMLEEGRADGMAVVWATAYLDEAARCGDVLLLHEGRLLAQGPPTEFLAPLEGRVFRLRVPVGERRAAARLATAHPAVLDAVVEGDALRIVLRQGVAVPGAPELGGEALEHLPPRFEDGFVAALAPPPPRPSRKGRGERPTPSPSTRGRGLGGGDATAITVTDLVRRFGAFTAVDHVSFAVRSRRDLRPAGPERRRQVHHLPHAVRPAAPLRRPGTRRRRRPRCAHQPKHARASATWRSASRSTRNCQCGKTCGSSRASTASAAPRRPRAIDAALTGFDLTATASSVAGELPLGLKQRLALAAALLHGPDILFLDEPTSGVDPLTRRDFWARIGTLADAGVTVMVTSHFMDEAEYCDRLGIVNQGKLAAVDTPAALRERVRTDALPEPTLEDAFIALVQTP